MASHSSDALSISGMVFITVMFLYTLANLTLVVISSMAWTKALAWIHSTECYLSNAHCGFIRWGLYFFISIAAFVSFITSAIMSCNSMSRSRKITASPSNILRSVVFTMALLAPLVVVGWFGLTTVDPDWFSKDSTAAFAQHPSNSSVVFGGVSGVFIIDSMDNTLPLSRIAFIMAHVNLAFGAFLAGITASVAAVPVADYTSRRSTYGQASSI